jgi:hypothetical protein
MLRLRILPGRRPAFLAGTDFALAWHWLHCENRYAAVASAAIRSAAPISPFITGDAHERSS